jgi:hypothetical protein
LRWDLTRRGYGTFRGRKTRAASVRHAVWWMTAVLRRRLRRMIEERLSGRRQWQLLHNGNGSIHPGRQAVSMEDRYPTADGASTSRPSRAVGRLTDVAAASTSPARLYLDRYGVDLGGRMSCPLMDPLYRLGTRSFGDAPHHAGLRVAPRPLEVDTLLVLDVEVSLVGLLKRFGRDAMHPVMNVHKFRHRCYSSKRVANRRGSASVVLLARADR